MPPEAMLGFDTADDAAVWRIAPNIAGILTIDFLTPIVDEPYDFGRIAAANALSDVFAMGGVPNVALNVVAMDSTLPEYVPRDMLRGGLEKAIEAGAVIMGGHSIDDEEPKYGLCVFGTVAPDALVRNEGAKPGDNRLRPRRPPARNALCKRVRREHQLERRANICGNRRSRAPMVPPGAFVFRGRLCAAVFARARQSNGRRRHCRAMRPANVGRHALRHTVRSGRNFRRGVRGTLRPHARKNWPRDRGRIGAHSRSGIMFAYKNFVIYAAKENYGNRKEPQ